MDTLNARLSAAYRVDLQTLRLALRRKDWSAAHETFATLLPLSRDMRRLFRKIAPTYVALGERDRLLDALWEERATTFSDLSLIASTMQLAGMEGWRERFEPALEEALGNDPRLLRFAEGDHLSVLGKGLAPELLQALIGLKWRDWPARTDEPVFDVMEREAWRVRPTGPLQTFVWDHSREQGMGRPAWEAAVAGACLMDHFYSDARHLAYRPETKGYFRGIYYESLFGPETDMSAFQTLKEASGLLLSTWHGSFFSAAARGFHINMPQAVRVVTLNARESTETMITTGPDRPNSAFLMMKALMKGRVVLIASDGPQGVQTVTRDVLGVPLSFSSGTALVAHEVGCRTGWYTYEREGEYARPVFAEGPQKTRRESFSDYQDRWFDFFIGKIEESLTGDPRSLPLRGAVINNISAHLIDHLA